MPAAVLRGKPIESVLHKVEVKTSDVRGRGDHDFGRCDGYRSSVDQADMSPAIGILLSISIITALGIAVLENPQVQVWVEQQRQKIIELLRSTGEELDPEARRQAEAFAYQGRAPATDAGLRRESDGAREAAAVATGRAMDVSPGATRRIPGRGLSDPDEAEERRRKGREYLARRNAQMIELRERRKGGSKLEGTAAPPLPTSFDEIVDQEGNLKGEHLVEKDLPTPPEAEPIPEEVQDQMRQVERQFVQPLLAAGESSSCAGTGGFWMGSMLSNPFSDEHAMDLDRSETPKPPPVPPKIKFERDSRQEDAMTPARHDSLPEDNLSRNVAAVPGSFDPMPQDLSASNESLTYEEQLALARALSLSEAESAASAAKRVQRDDDAVKAAIYASLNDVPVSAASAAKRITRDEDDAVKAATLASLNDVPTHPQVLMPLVDLTPSEPEPVQQGRADWRTVFDTLSDPEQDSATCASAPAQVARSEASEDELYRVTPQLTRARLASLEAQHASAPTTQLYDPVREAAESQAQWLEPPAVAEASFYSAPSTASPGPSIDTSGRDDTPQLVDVGGLPDREGTPTPTLSAAPSSARLEIDSESETFASVGGSFRGHSVAPSAALSDADVEVIDVLEDSDLDMLSEEGDGITTPDSWTEVGSRDGEDSDEDRQRQPVQL